MAKKTYRAEQLVKSGGKWYKPGEGVPVEEKEAEALLKTGAISTEPVRKQAETESPPRRSPRLRKEKKDTSPYGDWGKDQLVAEAEKRKLEVTRADGKDGAPLVTDYEKALIADDAGSE